ncbi:MAG: hypothetical protein B7Z80_03915 [Rhodospirillales bacterium 20-64-7]|nr:MAG: hypothetical protein B7Z80_03915 [Rhodospirillales bacterium 20-64-7]
MRDLERNMPLPDRLAPLIVAGLIASLGLVGHAWARPQPAPKPSGIVVHLFGPDSVASNILPAAPPAGAGAAAANAVAARPEAAAPAPSGGEILHQLFVTGAPDRPSAPSKGKAGGV